jgi:hypothetical protein
VGAILQIGSPEKFAQNKDLVRAAILATREGLNVYRTRGIDIKRAASMQLRLYALPLWFLVPVAQMNYSMPSIQQFLSENMAAGLEELSYQYTEGVTEGRRLGVAMPYLEGFGKCFALPSDDVADSESRRLKPQNAR